MQLSGDMTAGLSVSMCMWDAVLFRQGLYMHFVLATCVEINISGYCMYRLPEPEETAFGLHSMILAVNGDPFGGGE